MQRIVAMVRGGRARWVSAAAALLLTLCAVVGTFTPVDAQLGSADEDTTPVYLLARVQRLQAGDARGSYLIEFGVLPASMVDSAGGAPAAAAANARFLPERRYLSESTIRGRARAGDRRWLRSSQISIPVGAGDDPPVLQGRVIARWNPKDGGPLRIEFGFLPESAWTAAGGDMQAAARTHAVLPEQRYLSESTISGELRRSRPRWFRSSPSVDAPLSDDHPPPIGGGGSSTGTGGGSTEELRTPAINWQGYTPAVVGFGDAAPRLLLPTATANSEAVQLQYGYRVAPASAGVCSVDGQGALTILGIGDCHVQATNAATARYRSATASASVRVNPGDPMLRWAGYSPASARVGDPVRAPLPPTAAHPSIEFRYQSRTPALCAADPATGALMFLAAGSCSVTVSTIGGGSYRAAEVTVTVNITPGQETPVVQWAGYSNAAVTVGEPPLSPIPPSATVRGAAVNLLFRYSTENAGVCRVDENVGLLTPLGEGVCVVTATSVETTQYLPATATATVRVDIQQISVDRVSCDPASPQVSEQATCSATVSGGTPLGYAWASHGPGVSGALGPAEAFGDERTFATTFKTEGSNIVLVTVWDARGQASGQTTVAVRPGEVKPKIREATCTPTDPFVNETVRCSVTLSAGEPVTFSWSVNGEERGTDSEFRTTLTSAGRHTVKVIARNAHGADARSMPVSVEPNPDEPRCEALGDLRMNTRDYETEIDLVDVCSDPNGGALSFRVTANPPARGENPVRIGDPQGRGRRKTTYITPYNPGTATVTVTATNSQGLSGETSFRVFIAQATECYIPDEDLIFTRLRDSRGRTYEYDLDEICVGPSLRYGNATSTDPSVATGQVSGRTLTVTIRGVGVSYIRVTATGSDRETGRVEIEVTVNP